MSFFLNVYDLTAKIGLDTSEYDKGMGEAKSTASKIGGKIGDFLKAGATAGIAAIGTAAAAVGALLKQSIDSYGDYEQLTGGVETLYKNSADKIFKYANEAYKTAGMSANQYMELSTSFAASLINSLNGDTELAADLANMAIKDMSDNVNKMGSSTEAVQTAYNGFAKGNFTINNLMSAA